ncbi:MAG: 6-phosphogluconolactonase [Gammaproteobacteria bacterium]|nr:6-phosphogluconolactonase [Gammaproteobacteria bacterium]
MQADIQVIPDTTELSHVVAQWWLTLSQQAIQTQGGFYVALAGGSTPRTLYQLLSQSPYLDAVDWQKVHVYFGDERPVPLDHADSNYRMAWEALLSKVAIPEENVHPILIDACDIESSAKNYEATLQRTVVVKSNGIPRFDLILLGMGDDGHTASLFPDTLILDEKTKLVAPVYVEKLKTWRVSLTYPIINMAKHIAIIAAGDAKADKLYEICVKQTKRNPIEQINPEGELIWYLDSKAAKHLPPEMLNKVSLANTQANMTGA